MNSKIEDPILDAFLEEVVGGRTPPDLTTRIRSAWNARSATNQTADFGWLAAAATCTDEADSPAPPPRAVVPSPTPVPLAGTENRRARHRHRSPGPWFALAFSTGALGLSVAVAALILSVRSPAGRVPAASVAEVPARISPDIDIRSSEPLDASLPPATPPIVRKELATVPPPASDSVAAQSPLVPAPTLPLPEPRASKPEPAAIAAASLPAPEKPSLQPSSNAEIVSFVNAELAHSWNQSGLTPAPAASDAEWCQRLFVRLLGRAPNARELKEFLDDSASDRREQLVDRLLSEQRYVQQYARQWATVWTNALIGRAASQSPNAASREDLEKYFRDALLTNKRYDKIVQELLTANGSSRPGASDYNPAVNFLLDRLDPNAVVPTARVARTLLGHQLQCAQCHDHPSQGWSQEQFWALNAFLRQMRAERQDDNARLLSVDFPGSRRSSRDGEVYYETPDGLMKTAFPRFLDGTEIARSGELATVDRRRELARFVTQSADLSKAVVNRVWAQFFDFGFSRPVDDLGPNTVLSQPEAFDRLASELAAHDYDLKLLIRWIVLSDAFKRSSRVTDLLTRDMPEEGGLAFFSRFYARPTQTADVVASLVQASRIRGSAMSDREREQARVDWLARFNRSPQREAGKASVAAASAVLDASPTIRGATANEAGGLLKQIAASSMPFEQKVQHLFLAAVARFPSAREQRAAADVLTASGGEHSGALDDIWWSLLSSNECVLDR
jgi:hypothetical protein